MTDTTDTLVENPKEIDGWDVAKKFKEFLEGSPLSHIYTAMSISYGLHLMELDAICSVVKGMPESILSRTMRIKCYANRMEY